MLSCDPLQGMFAQVFGVPLHAIWLGVGVGAGDGGCGQYALLCPLMHDPPVLPPPPPPLPSPIPEQVHPFGPSTSA
jgi:hypothetical protein